MQPVERFSLRREDPREPSAPSGARLMQDGEPTPLRLGADAISGQYACTHGFLLLLTSVTFEPGEALRLLLLDPALRTLDAADLDYHSFYGVPTAAELSAQRVVGPDELEFAYGESWRVRVLPAPTRIPQEWFVRQLFREPGPRKLRYLWFRKLR